MRITVTIILLLCAAVHSVIVWYWLAHFDLERFPIYTSISFWSAIISATAAVAFWVSNENEEISEAK